MEALVISPDFTIEDIQKKDNGKSINSAKSLTRIEIRYIIIHNSESKDDDGDVIFILKVTESRVC